MNSDKKLLIIGITAPPSVDLIVGQLNYFQKNGFKEEIATATDPLEASKISGWCCVLEGTYHCKTTRRDVRSSDYYVLVMLSGSNGVR